MNCILFSQEHFLDGPTRVALTGRHAAHITTVLRAAVGDELRVGLVNGMMGTGRIVALEAGRVIVDTFLTVDPPPALPVTVVLALPRPIVLNRVIAMITSFGVKKIILLHANRVEKSFWNSPVVTAEHLREQMLLGLEQACDTVLPEIIFKKKFKPFVHDELPLLLRDGHGFVAHPDDLRIPPTRVSLPAVLCIGPEGGFIPYEIDLFLKVGVVPVSLGARILRVETAVAALLAKCL